MVTIFLVNNYLVTASGEEQVSLAYFPRKISQKLGSNLLVLPTGELPPELLHYLF